MAQRFYEAEVFPVIIRIIDEICQYQDYADRYEIAERLLGDEEGQILVEKALSSDGPKISAKRIAGNMVDWFSADITKDSPIISQWNGRYIRKRVNRQRKTSSGYKRIREVWAYGLANPNIYPEEVSDEQTYIEGTVRKISINAYERNTQARLACVEHYGAKCQVCSIDFEKYYGLIGQGYIHVHHLVPLAEVQQEYEINPIRDLRPICPNCHAMLHKRNPPFTIEELKDIIKAEKGKK